ncbi:UNVERIFIED_CONTAM: hypothetical protein RMT77_019804, partial [Armadillidium vulgare]
MALMDIDTVIGDTFLLRWVKDIQYQAFDPRKINIMVTQKISEIALESKGQDIGTMIALFCERGNKIEKILRTITMEAAIKVNKLKRVYNIVESGKGSSEAITLARVALSFPWSTCEYMAVCKNHPVSPMEMNAYIEGEHPKQMMTSAFRGLIPTTALFDKLCFAFALHQFKFSRVVNPKVIGPPKERE